MRNPETLPPTDAWTLAYIKHDREVTVSYDLAHQFLTMVRQRTPDAFEPWLQACVASHVAEMQTFAAGLQQDRAAMAAALTATWSTGPVEGHINRLKLVKRQMFGRANFDLLKRRVLHSA